MNGSIPPPPLYSFMAWTGEMFLSYSLYENIVSALLHSVKKLSGVFYFRSMARLDGPHLIVISFTPIKEVGLPSSLCRFSRK